MIPLVPTSQAQVAPLSGSWNPGALIRSMLDAWLAHHRRLADCGFCGGL